MNIIGVKFILSGVFFFSTLICSILPISIFSWIKNREKINSTLNRTRTTFPLFNIIINCITCFGAGVFLGACLLDLLPDVIHHIDETLKVEFKFNNEPTKRYPIAELLITLGLFFVLFIEQLILSMHSSSSSRSMSNINKRSPIIMSHEDDETALNAGNDEAPLMVNTNSGQHQFNIGELKEDINASKNRVMATRNLIMILSLIIHSLFEGFALGSLNEHHSLVQLFLAIVIHKSIIAFSVGLKLMRTTNKNLVYLACFLFSCATPIGILFVISMQELLPNNRSARVINDILRAFACGTFFYITFFDVLPHELNMSSISQRISSHSNRYRLFKVIFILFGFGFIAILSFTMK